MSNKATADVRQKAEEILKSGKIEEYLGNISQKGQESLTKTDLLGKLSTIKDYLLDSKVPMGKKVIILAMVIYIVSPIDLLPGPLDDLVVFGFLVKKIQSELEAYERGDYEKGVLGEEWAPDNTPEPDFTNNPFRVDKIEPKDDEEDEVDFTNNPFRINQ